MAMLMAACSTASAVVVHPEHANSSLEAPSSELIGAWATSGSCVAIAPNYVVTASHVSTVAVGKSIEIAGNTWEVAESVDHPDVDLRIARIASPGGAPANLTRYAPLYTGNGETQFDRVVIGGVGKVRGDTLVSGGQEYGYTWATNTGRGVHFGANLVDSVLYPAAVLLEADFDGPGDDDYIQDHECVVAEFDSGGGWLVHRNNQWELAGITLSITGAWNESWFRKPYAPEVPDPDRMQALRVSEYADWITHEERFFSAPILDGDLDWDGYVDQEDSATLQQYYGSERTDLTWAQGDLTGDGRVTFADAWLLKANLGRSSIPPAHLPEPGTAAVLLALGAAIGRRRR
jgi:hypothetical protein